jgi:hypothetical protein
MSVSSQVKSLHKESTKRRAGSTWAARQGDEAGGKDDGEEEGADGGEVPGVEGAGVEEHRLDAPPMPMALRQARGGVPPSTTKRMRSPRTIGDAGAVQGAKFEGAEDEPHNWKRRATALDGDQWPGDKDVLDRLRSV